MEKYYHDFKVILFAFLLALFLRFFVFNVVIVNQTSMYPTLHPKDVILSSSFYKFKKEYKRGDIIVFKSKDENKLLVKRIIGLPKDKIEIIDGSVYVNGNRLNEYYLVDGSYTYSDKEIFSLSEDELFVIGDNRTLNGSYDSRNFGPIKTDTVVSKPFFRIFPLNSKKFINGG